MKKKNMKKKAALDAFKMVLRSRPDMALSRKEHPVKDIDLWEKARTQLKKDPKGKLVLDTEPSGAELSLDGAKVGATPFIGTFPIGRYHMRLHDKGTGLSISRWVEVGEEKMTRSRVDLAFESSLLTGLSQPAIRSPEGQIEIPDKWWPWLGEMLEIGLLVVVDKGREVDRNYWTASLIDLKKGRLVRKVRLEAGGSGAKQMDEDAGDIAEFVTTGKMSEKMTLLQNKAEEPAGKRIEKSFGAESVASVETTAPAVARSWYRKWWPYAVGGAVLLGGGVAANLVANDYYEDTGGLAHKQDAADIWMGVAIGGYVLAGAAILTGILLHATYEPSGDIKIVAPAAFVDGVGFQVIGSF